MHFTDMFSWCTALYLDTLGVRAVIVASENSFKPSDYVSLFIIRRFCCDLCSCFILFWVDVSSSCTMYVVLFVKFCVFFSFAPCAWVWV